MNSKVKVGQLVLLGDLLGVVSNVGAGEYEVIDSNGETHVITPPGSLLAALTKATTKAQTRQRNKDE